MPNIFYVGKDEVFYKKLKDSLAKNFNEKELSLEIFNPAEHNINVIFRAIARAHASIIYVDFSFQSNQMRQLAWNLRVNSDTRNAIVVGLLNAVETQQNDEKGEQESAIEHAIITQAHLIHSKGAEITDIISDPFVLSELRTDLKGQYATYKQLELDMPANCICKLSYITKEYIITESRARFPVNQKYFLKVPAFRELNQFNYTLDRADNDFLRLASATRHRFKIPFVAEDEDDPNVNQEKYNETFQTLDNCFDTDRTRVLIIDKKLTALKKIDSDFEKLNIITRYQATIGEDSSIIKNLRPNIISFRFEKEPEDCPEDEAIERCNGVSALQILVEKIKAIGDYNPVIKIFNSESGSAAFQKILSYRNIISSAMEPDLNFLGKMIQIFKMKNKGQPVTKGDSLIATPHVRIPSLDIKSILFLELPIIVKSISEHEIDFYCPVELPARTLLTLDHPLKILVTISPNTNEMEKRKDLYPHTAFIHGVNELQRIDIRKYVNQLFFTKHNEKKQLEKDEFVKKNIEAQREREKGKK